MTLDESQYVDKLWQEWVTSYDEQVGNELVRHYMYLVNFHVERVAAYIPDSFDKNDLRSLGLMGLFDALNKFEPNRKLKFDTYATIRVHGSIMDGLRKEDWLPRTLRDHSKKVEAMTQSLEQDLQRKPTSGEIARELDLTEEEVEDSVVHTLYANKLSLNMVVQSDDNDDSTEISASIKAEQRIQPEMKLLESERSDELKEAMIKLNENEQLVVSLFYMDELTLTEIGKVLNLTTSRISQIHKRALFKLKDILIQL